MRDPGSGTLLIATTPRSGSWLLSDLLSRSAGVGLAQEYFHVNYVAAKSHECGLSTSTITKEYIEQILSQARAEGVMFSSKLHWLQINQLVDALRLIHPGLAEAGASAPDLIEASLPAPCYLYLTRSDKARQAISMFRALRTDDWWELADSSSAAGVRATRHPPTPDYLAIRWLEQDLINQDAEWRRYFEHFGIAPWTVVYERLTEGPGNVVRGILDWLGFAEAAAVDGPSRLRRQSDAETERILIEYRQVRDSLPPCPQHWHWSFRRRMFGPPEAPRAGEPEATTEPSASTLTSLKDLSPF